MKIFIFGIDGLGKASLEALGLNRLAMRIEKGFVGNPAIHNVVSRGWPEIYAGKTAFETGAFYQSPELRNGQIYPTQKTGLSLIKRTMGNDLLLWNKLNAMGYKVGIFTVPTLTVPENVNGFCVGATGAGKFGNSFSKDDYFPDKLFDGIQVDDVDLGLRMGYGAFLPDSIEELETYASKHLDDYFRLLQHSIQTQPVDVCFAATRFINEMGYKFLGVCLDKPKNDFEVALQKAVRSLCNKFDEMLDTLINKINPEHFFLVSDHGLKRFDYELNLNELLCEMGLVERRSIFTDWKALVRPLYFWIKKNLLNKKLGHVLPSYALEISKVFSIGFTNVLYLNDDRFTGKHYQESERLELLEKLIGELNTKVASLGFEHLVSFKLLPEGKTSFVSPDILCQISDGIANTERQHVVFFKRDFAFKKMFTEGFYGEHSGCKSDDTIAAYEGARTQNIRFDKLTDVYGSILSVAEACLD